jgi:hypothetical protein
MHLIENERDNLPNAYVRRGDGRLWFCKPSEQLPRTQDNASDVHHSSVIRVGLRLQRPRKSGYPLRIGIQWVPYRKPTKPLHRQMNTEILGRFTAAGLSAWQVISA